MAKKLYAVVDIETTGARADQDRITEVAIVVFDGEHIVDQFDSLINPERSIPYNITQITGINDKMVENAPKFYEVAKTIVEMTQNAVFVAHNVRFDYNFLRKEFKALGYIFKRKQLCTVKLARRVFTGLPSYSLGNLIRYFDIKVSRRHRALDDALATTEILGLMMKEDSDRPVLELVNLGIEASKLPPNISLDRLHALPEGCGVYYFYDQFGDLLYVGKSINIKKRIMGHFGGDSRKSEHIQAAIREISFEETGSELIALLLEESEIKKLRPRMNRMLRRRKYRYCIHRKVNEEGFNYFDISQTDPELDVVKEFTGKTDARGTLAYIVREFELCRCLCNLNKRAGHCFDYQLQNCQGAYLGHEELESYNERFDLADERLRQYPAFPEDFLIIGEGRVPGEISVISVQDGHYQGFGFIEQSEAHSLENLLDAIKPHPHNKDVIWIIKDYLRKHPKVKTLKIKDMKMPG